MTKLYRITPRDKKSVECYYEVYKQLEDGTFKIWDITETYRWGQGFQDIDDPIYSTDTEISVDSQLGWGCELDDLCACHFEFDKSYTDEEKQEIEDAWGEGGIGWLYDGEHDWQVECDIVTLYGPFKVDIVDEDEYNTIIEEDIKLEPRPVFNGSDAWPFATIPIE